MCLVVNKIVFRELRGENLLNKGENVMLMRVYVILDKKHRIVLPSGIRKALGIRPGDKLALTLVGMNAVRKALLSKPQERKIDEKTYSRPRR